MLPAPQLMAQPPQLAGSVCSLTHAPPPVAGSAPHTVSPAPHWPTHTLLEHEATPPVGALQILLQPPQLLGSLVSLTQAPPPVLGDAPHTVSPAPHWPTQMLPEHEAAPPVGALQIF